jgi:phage terminase large subunit-like protein
MSWDIALSEKAGADYSTCVVLHLRGDHFSVLEDVRGLYPFDLLK